MRLVTLSTLQTRVQRAADIESATTRFPLSEITDYINEGFAELYEELVKITGHDSYFRKSYPFTTLANQSSYAAPSDFLKLISIDVIIGGANLVLTARPYMENERNRFKFFPTGWNYGHPIYYKLEGSNINFIPNPQGGFQAAMNYVPTSVVLVNPGDSVDGVSGWEEFVVCWAAKRVARKDKDWETHAALDAELEKQRERVRDKATERDDQPERIHDVADPIGGDGDYGLGSYT